MLTTSPSARGLAERRGYANEDRPRPLAPRAALLSGGAGPGLGRNGTGTGIGTRTGTGSGIRTGAAQRRPRRRRPGRPYRWAARGAGGASPAVPRGQMCPSCARGGPGMARLLPAAGRKERAPGAPPEAQLEAQLDAEPAGPIPGPHPELPAPLSPARAGLARSSRELLGGPWAERGNPQPPWGPCGRGHGTRREDAGLAGDDAGHAAPGRGVSSPRHRSLRGPEETCRNFLLLLEVPPPRRGRRIPGEFRQGLRRRLGGTAGARRSRRGRELPAAPPRKWPGQRSASVPCFI